MLLLEHDRNKPLNLDPKHLDYLFVNPNLNRLRQDLMDGVDYGYDGELDDDDGHTDEAFEYWSDHCSKFRRILDSNNDRNNCRYEQW